MLKNLDILKLSISKLGIISLKNYCNKLHNK